MNSQELSEIQSHIDQSFPDAKFSAVDVSLASSSSAPSTFQPATSGPITTTSSMPASSRLADVINQDFDVALGVRPPSRTNSFLEREQQSHSGRQSPSMRGRTGKAPSRCSSPKHHRSSPYSSDHSPFRKRTTSVNDSSLDSGFRQRVYSTPATGFNNDMAPNHPRTFSTIQPMHNLQRSYSVGARDQHGRQSEHEVEDALSSLFEVALGNGQQNTKMKQQQLPPSFFRLKAPVPQHANRQQSYSHHQHPPQQLPQMTITTHTPDHIQSRSSTFSGHSTGFTPPNGTQASSSDPNLSQVGETSPLSQQLQHQFGLSSSDEEMADSSLEFLNEVGPLLGVELSLLGMDNPNDAEESLFDDLSLQFPGDAPLHS